MGRPAGSKNRTDRPNRISFAQQRNTLTYENKDKDYVYRVFNDVDGRLQNAETAGFEYVHDKEQLGDPVADGSTHIGSVVTKPVGGGKNGVLMRIKREWYEEDQAEKQRNIDETEATLKAKANEDGHYGNINIKKSG